MKIQRKLFVLKCMWNVHEDCPKHTRFGSENLWWGRNCLVPHDTSKKRSNLMPLKQTVWGHDAYSPENQDYLKSIYFENYIRLFLRLFCGSTFACRRFFLSRFFTFFSLSLQANDNATQKMRMQWKWIECRNHSAMRWNGLKTHRAYFHVSTNN